jgi:hypothetical protein
MDKRSSGLGMLISGSILVFIAILFGIVRLVLEILDRKQIAEHYRMQTLFKPVDNMKGIDMTFTPKSI